jgi:hypothetical protein
LGLREDKFWEKKMQRQTTQLKQELKTLEELGLSPEEISYIVFLKQKEHTRKKWD